MTADHPLPFRLKLPGEDTIDSRGVRSVSYRLHGLLHVSNEALEFEWVAQRHLDVVGLSGVTDRVEESPIGRVTVAREWITGARVTGWWWSPRLHLFARRIAAFEGIPSARPGVLTLLIGRKDRRLATEIARRLVAGALAHPIAG